MVVFEGMKCSETAQEQISAVYLLFSSFGTFCKKDKRCAKKMHRNEDNMYKSYSMELCGRTLTVDVGRVAAQANGAAFMHYGDTVVLSTATASEEPRDGH